MEGDISHKGGFTSWLVRHSDSKYELMCNLGSKAERIWTDELGFEEAHDLSVHEWSAAR